ncbi:surface-adhesin E family protein [Gloeobacter kilaueensis]|uniref:Carbonic anhydrase n=1 Tax=Gloeobacter kilaueensis (strain ATCC BAA-2537 / CCAP 1431/1 / ULC 316 / JS1) TaxID=1183438 RepID=U5QKJ2_GLOK1|nr:surface-adhesin E family protein [Gloeobacter kilaueensis]AGY59431.1 carbonic anhydrase [Gloeobacter kilaueensis JS1]
MTRAPTKATIILAVLLPSLFVSIGSARAEKWVDIAVSSEANTHAINIDSITFLNDLVKFWKRIILKKPEHLPDGTTYDRTLTLNYVDCTERKAGFTRLILYKKEKAVGNDVYPLDLKQPAPESITARVIDEVCEVAHFRKAVLSGDMDLP